MARFRIRGVALLILVLAFALTQTGSAQPQGLTTTFSASAVTDSTKRSYKIYSLAKWDDDPNFGEWVAQTITKVIAPDTWKGPCSIRYYAPKKILVVCHDDAVHAKVKTFLKDVKKSLREEKKVNAAAHHHSAPGHDVVPTAYPAPGLLKAAGPSSEPSLSYPVPAPVKAPKHLFHFIIRYEGEGLIDDSVVKALRTYTKAEKAASVNAAPTTAEVDAPPPLRPSVQSLSPAVNSAPSDFAEGKAGSKKNPKDKKDTEKKKEESPDQP